MNIVIITNIPSPYRVDLFNYLNENYDFDITILYSSTNEDNRKWEVGRITHNYKVLNSKTIKLKSKLDYKYIHIPSDIIYTLNKIKPDIIVGSEYNPTVLLAYYWCRLKKKKFVSWSDGTLNSERDINAIQKLIRKSICKNADSLIASSSKTREAQMFYGANKEKIVVSYLTVDINKYIVKREKNNDNSITFVGRLVKTKGIDLLIDAIAELKCNYKLNIIGDGPEYENIKNQCILLGIDDKVTLYGNMSREFIVKMYSKSRIMVLPSRKECFGLVITEAMCAGLPIISSKYVDGSYDLIINEKNGFIIDPYNKEEFSNKIKLLLEDEELNFRMGIESRKMVNEFSLERVAECFIKAIID